MNRRGFTLVELMIVAATLALLAALLFPVFRSAKDAAKRANCVSNFRQSALASQLYLSDYDDGFMLTHQQFSRPQDPATDRTWVQLLLPYARSMMMFRCPSDYTRKAGDSYFEPDLGVGDAYTRFYQESIHSNIGYNFQYLAPVIKMGKTWQTVPRIATMANDPSHTVLFADSAYEVEDGVPRGGGHYLVVPPCRYFDSANGGRDSFAQSASEVDFYSPEAGWPGESGKFAEFGHVWHWHRDLATVQMLDGSTKALPIRSLLVGCNASPDWQGRITDSTQYMWDLR